MHVFPELISLTAEHPIILSDSDPQTLNLYEMMFCKHSLHCITTPDPRQIISICQQRPISLIVSDLNKPYMSGIDLFQKLQTIPEAAAIPFMLVTTCSEFGLKDHFLAIGGAAFMQKPVQLQVLLETAISLLMTQMA